MKAPNAAAYIHEGIWTNWQKGRFWGSTLTVTPAHAAVITPALAVLISIAGGQLWRLFQYALHQVRATNAPRDFLYHQQQVSLRNTTTDLNALWRLVRLALAWRHQRDIHTWRRSLPLIIWTLFHLVVIILVSTFSAKLLSGGNQVLSRSPWCGWYSNAYLTTIYSTVPTEDVVTKAMEYENNLNTIYASIQQHVDICGTSVDGCNTLLPSTFNFTTDFVPGDCPFEARICHPDAAGSMSFDTGFLSSSVALGLNAVQIDRVSFRLLAQCSPLNDAEHTSGWQSIDSTSSEPSHDVADAFYGPTSITERNATWSAVKQYMHCDQRRVTPPYALSAKWCGPGGSIKQGTATFDPIPQLQSADADTEIIMLAFNGAFYGPVTDPWFSSRQSLNETNAFCAHQNKTLYVRDRPITSIGCTQQWQICNTEGDIDESKSCTPRLGLSQLKALMTQSSNSTLSLTTKQRVTVNRITQVSNGAFFHQVIGALTQSATAPLQARHLMTRTISTALPSNQWQIETKYWFTLLLAYVQQVSLQISTGQFAASTDYINVTKSSDTDPVQNAAYNLCRNQIVLNDTYQNFNFFGLLLTLALCSIVVVLGLTIEDVVGFIRQRRLQYTDHDGKQDMWTLNSDLEMLKTISELKQGTVWTRSKSSVPLAQPGCKTGIFELDTDTIRVEDGKGVVHRRTDTRIAGESSTSRLSHLFRYSIPTMSLVVGDRYSKRYTGLGVTYVHHDATPAVLPSSEVLETKEGTLRFINGIQSSNDSTDLADTTHEHARAREHRVLHRHSTYRGIS